jgi:dimethylhistidine N-methyltransferase
MNIAASPIVQLSAHKAFADPEAAFYHDVVTGLRRAQKSLPCKYLYDQRGARLFDDICQTPEYYPTRTEIAILKTYGDEIADLIGPHAQIVEFGSGSGIKTRLLLRSVKNAAAYVGVDISRTCLDDTTTELECTFPELEIKSLWADFTQPFTIPRCAGAKRRIGFFPGSTIGNFAPTEAQDFLHNAARTLGHGGALLVGVDLKKEKRVLEAAYNDAAGVTAAFNLNLLDRINRTLNGTFDTSGFAHNAHYNAVAGRIEMHLYSLAFQSARVGSQMFSFSAGESIHTENAYKYSIGEFQALAESCGFSAVKCWTDESALFSVHFLQAL